LLNAVEVYIVVLRRAVHQLIHGTRSDEIEITAARLRILDPGHPVLPALDERVRATRERLTLH
jgi:regulator of protease activity HflC (stomatin/prohibitin superfamily)